MKKCTYCGKEQPDEAAVCSLDGQPLVDFKPTKPSPSENKEVQIKKAPQKTSKASYAIVLPIVILIHITFLMSGSASIDSTGSLMLIPIEVICVFRLLQPGN